MTLRYSPAARDDLRRIRAYIRDELAHPLSADRIVAGIVRRCADLKRRPLVGASIQPHVERRTDVRSLHFEGYVAFYRVEESSVSVLRVLHVRQDFVAALGLGDERMGK